MVVPGRRPALEAVRAGSARELLIAEEARSTVGLREVLEAAAAAGVRVRRVPTEDIDRQAGGVLHQGVLAVAVPPAPLGEADLMARRWPEEAVVLVADGVSDPQNLGALARTAEAAGASLMVLRERRGGGATAAAVKASAGALLHLRVASVPNLPRAIAGLKDRGFWVAGLDARASLTIWETRPPGGRVALVVGAEGEGLSRLVRERCDFLVRIPMRGRVGSLNVAVAAGIALFGYALPGKEAGGP